MFMTLDVLDEDGKHMFFCVFGQTQKQAFFTVFLRFCTVFAI